MPAEVSLHTKPAVLRVCQARCVPRVWKMQTNATCIHVLWNKVKPMLKGVAYHS